MRMTLEHNIDGAITMLVNVDKQHRFAVAVALTRTAQDVRNEQRNEMRQVFVRPTPYTLNSLFVSPATKVSLTAQVWLKDDRAGSGTPATRYLLPQIVGGERRMKAFEQALQAHGLMPRNARAVPASGVKLDSYGNVPRGTMVQILSQLRVQMMAGYESRASGSARSKRNVRRQGFVYFTLQHRHGKLLPGIYGRKALRGGASTVVPMFLFVQSVRYKPVYNFKAVSERVARERFPVHYAKALADALRTAR